MCEHRINEANREIAALRHDVKQIKQQLDESLVPIEEHLRIPLSVLAFTISELRTYRAHLEELGLVNELALLNENIGQLEDIFNAWNRTRKEKANGKNQAAG